MRTQDRLFYRGVDLDRAKVDPGERSVDVAFSSEAPVPRWFGNEILLHGRDNVDLSRLKSMGATLMNHNPNVIVGPIQNVRIENQRGKATLIFDDDEDGERAFKKVQSGSLRGVSVGYMIEKAQEVREGDEYNGLPGPALIGLRWAPYEISLTPIPADPSVGVGRDLTRSLDGVEIVRAPAGLSVSSQAPELRVSLPELQELMSKAGNIGPEAKIRIIDMVGEGRTMGEMSRELLRLAAELPTLNACRPSEPKPESSGHIAYRKVEDVPDDVLIRMICNPYVSFQ